MAALGYCPPSHHSTINEAAPPEIAAIAHIASVLFGTLNQRPQRHKTKVVFMTNRDAACPTVTLGASEPAFSLSFILNPLEYMHFRWVSGPRADRRSIEYSWAPIGAQLARLPAFKGLLMTCEGMLDMDSARELQSQIQMQLRTHLPGHVSLGFNWPSSSWPISFAKFREGRLEEIRPLQELSLKKESMNIPIEGTMLRSM